MRTKAIIIRKTPINEHDQLVTLYSEDFGTMRALARGSFKPTSVQSLHLDNLNLIEFEVINGRSMPIISSANVVSQFVNIKTALPRLAAAQFFTEVLDKISFENERDPKLWDFLNAMLSDFDSVPADEIFPKFRQHQSEFLKVLGYAPRTDRCIVCSGDALNGPERMIALSPELGGVMCAECFLASGRGILFDRADLALLSGSNISPVPNSSALDTFFEYTVGKKLSSLSFIYQIFSK